MTEIWEKTSNNWRVKYVEDVSAYEDNPSVLINPDKSDVKGHPPHTWKAHPSIKNKFVLATEAEQAEVGDNHQLHGVANGIRLVHERPVPIKLAPHITYVTTKTYSWVSYVALAASIISLIVSLKGYF